MEQPEIWKFAVYGEVNVGTTAFVYRYINNVFFDFYDPGYMPYDCMQKQSMIDGIPTVCKIYDLALNEEDPYNKVMIPLAIKDCSGFILAYSAINRGPFSRMQALIDRLIEFLNYDDLEKYPMIIIATKNDLKEEIAVSDEEGQALARHYNVPWFSTSARTGENITETVEEMVRLLRAKKKESLKKKKDKPAKKTIPPMNTIPVIESTLANDIMAQLFNVEKYSDLTMLVDEKPIYVHKAILFARSPSFMEKITPTDKVMNLTDLNYMVVLSIMKYLYIGKFTRENISNEEYKKAIMKLEVYNLLPILKDENKNIEIEGFVPAFTNLFNFNFSSDLKIIVKESKKKLHEIFCHKMILCARSEYFRVMYQGGFKDSDSPEMIVDDCSYEAMLFLIKYYYMDVSEIEDESMVLDLLKVAHRYNEAQVLRMIEIFLAKTLTVENVCMVLQLCDMFSLTALKQACSEFISYRFEKVVKTSAFKKLGEEVQKRLQDEQKKGPWLIPKTETDVLVKLLKSFSL